MIVDGLHQPLIASASLDFQHLILAKDEEKGRKSEGSTAVLSSHGAFDEMQRLFIRAGKKLT